MAGKGGKMRGATVKIDGEKLRTMIEDYWPHSRASFARECGIDPSTLSKMLLRGSCNAEMLNRVARRLDMSEPELMDAVSKYKSVPHSYRAKANMSRSPRPIRLNTAVCSGSAKGSTLRRSTAISSLK